jgi:hypothetical protein
MTVPWKALRREIRRLEMWTAWRLTLLNDQLEEWISALRERAVAQEAQNIVDVEYSRIVAHWRDSG